MPLLEKILRHLGLRAEPPRTWVPPGHYYSPIPSAAELRAREHQLFGPPPATLAGIDLRENEQLSLLRELAAFYAELPFPRAKTHGLRYWFDNPSYSYADAIFLYGMLRRLRPRRVIEVGCGWSSAAMLDTADRFLGSGVAFTFVEPYPDTLRGLLRPGERCELIEMKLQDVPLERFEALEANDVLFVDSTHVAKAGSDVNRIVFEILPRLRAGVHVHFHDVFYPFEYPKPWLYDERGWNEDYFLRAFLQYNSAFEIALFGTYLIRFHREWFAQHMPLCLENPGGSLWIRRV